jgi:ABC-2 type transport system permease protein
VAEVLRSGVRGYRDIARMWMRASLAYPASFWMLAASGFAVTGLDFLGIWIMFTTVESLGGFDLAEIAFLYGATGLGLGIADLFVGRIERLGQMIRLGRLDAMMVRPIPLLAQVCADEFALRRVARVVQAGLIFTIGGWYVDWSLPKAGLAGAMVVSASVIFLALFIGFACLQFWTSDASEVANAFTYGGNTVTQYPLSIFPREVVTGLTFLVPLAFVNWYPALYILDRSDPFGFPAWLQFASPLAALVLGTLAVLVWRTGVRHYSSTGS